MDAPREDYAIRVYRNAGRSDPNGWYGCEIVSDSVWVGAIPDTVRPAKAQGVITAWGKTTAMIEWTEPGDDSLTGRAVRVRIRYSTAPVTEENFFSSADTFPNPGVPLLPGAVHCASAPAGALVGVERYCLGNNAGCWCVRGCL
jgi:hypothetical protein